MTHLMHWLDTYPLLWPMFIFLARLTDVSIGTLRTMCVVRGMRWLAPILGFFEITIWITAVSGVLTHLDHWYNILAYAGGFAAGNSLGILLEQKIAIGMQAIRLISKGRSAAVAEGLRLAGFVVTEITGHGNAGDVSLSIVVVPRRYTPVVLKVAHGVDPDVLSSIEDLRSATLHYYPSVVPPTGWRAILKKK
ncbi:MAG: hypothetical protein JXA69_06075 [Phycisphaerae bacterium]|nr:hypothetical protein [Phycisphaerae bacterium]